MNDSYDELSRKLFLASHKFYESGEHYYAASRERSNTSSLKSVAQDYRNAGEAYLAALSNCEHHLLSEIQNEDVKKELESIRSRQHSIATIIMNLK
jgi:hypothetical protein